MIANKSNQMSIEILSFDSALLSPSEMSFFSTDDGLQTQHYSQITPQLASDEWLLQDFEDITFCDGFEFGLNYEPELTLEAMTKEADIQYHSKSNEIIDYLDSTAFLSPLSIEPSSPQTSEADVGQQPDSEMTIASDITLLEELLSANSSDSEYLSDQCLDSELNIQSITEVSKESQKEESPPLESNKKAPKRQYKRKAQPFEPKTNKKSKTLNERRERKRTQNKSAANRYRQKKREELFGIEKEQNNYELINNRLKAQLQKLQMEFKVVYPLAKAAFAADPQKSLQIQMVDLRVLNQNLLD
jgi:hypothetical protein